MKLLAATAPLLRLWGVRWIEAQRAIHHPAARPLERADLDRLAGFFAAETLAAARVRRLARLEPPRAARAMLRVGISLPVELDRLWAITFVDTIVVLDAAPEAELTRTLFHELVHVVQYRLLGTRGFVERYVRGWLDNGRRYGAIPLEADAYELARRYVSAPDPPFDVEGAVARLTTLPSRPARGPA